MTDLLHHPLVEFTTEHAPLQFINEHGQRVENQHNAEFDQYLAHLSVEDLKSFYRDMMVVRRFDVEATALQRQGELALYAPCWGKRPHRWGQDVRWPPQTWCFRRTVSTVWRTLAAWT